MSPRSCLFVAIRLVGIESDVAGVAPERQVAITLRKTEFRGAMVRSCLTHLRRNFGRIWSILKNYSE